MVVQGLNDNNKVPIIRQSGDSQPLVSCHGKGQPVIKRGTTEEAGEGGVHQEEGGAVCIDQLLRLVHDLEDQSVHAHHLLEY